MSSLIKAGQFGNAPLNLRMKYAWQQGWYIFLLLLPLLGFSIYLVATQGVHAGTVSMLGVLLATVGVGLWGLYWYGFSHSKPWYHVKGVKVTFVGKYYVPPDIMGSFIQEVIDLFEPFYEGDPQELMNGVKLVVTEYRPRDPANRQPNSILVGTTYPGERRSYVYGPYALSHGGAGYELRLQMCHALFPNRSEQEDLDWMVENDII